MGTSRGGGKKEIMRAQIEKAVLTALKTKLAPQLASEAATEIADAVEAALGSVAVDLATALQATEGALAKMAIDPKRARRHGKRKVKGRRGRPPGSGRGPGRPPKPRAVEPAEDEEDYEVVAIDLPGEDEDLEV